MTDKMIVFVTCESREQGERIAQLVVSEKLAACVNVLGGVRSCYVWEGTLTWSEETMLMIKTTLGRFEQLRERVRKEHSYELPEIVGVGIDEAEMAYLDWIDRGVGGQ
jgi:periplasmic divalent cation tolerance protein